MKVEYDIKPTGPGTIKVKVTKKNPTSPDPEVSEVEFVVE